MSQKHKIENIILRYIKSNHTLGDQSGGSGHMGHVSCTLDEFDFKELGDGNIEVQFKYTLLTETEFTYYPDNPPQEDKYEKSLLLNRELQIIETT